MNSQNLSAQLQYEPMSAHMSLKKQKKKSTVKGMKINIQEIENDESKVSGSPGKKKTIVYKKKRASKM